jgi:hypothetical protein
VVRFLDKTKGGEKKKVASALMASAFALATLAPAAFAVYPRMSTPLQEVRATSSIRATPARAAQTRHPSVLAVKTPTIRATRRAPGCLRSSNGLSPQLSALTLVADVGAASGVRESQLSPGSSGCGEYLAHLSRKREPTSGLEALTSSHYEFA